ncbi:MAG: leucine-rich repeat domain-containing protein [Spirochaetales bacterium]|jgi:hypothetical protein|nr:leucine-rich repeat domain-containing protein [Spirochaetales bacterium]
MVAGFRLSGSKIIFLCLYFFSVPVLIPQDTPQPDSSTQDFAIQINGEEDSRTITITRYLGNSADVEIPRAFDGIPVRAIGDLAFCRLAPETKTIEGMDIQSIDIPPGVRVIGDHAFYGNHLTSVRLPEELRVIGNAAFAENRLESLRLPHSLTSIGLEAFARNSIPDIELPPGLESLGGEAFAENRIARLSIPQSLRVIEDYAFAWNRLTSLAIPENILSVGKGAFAGNAIAELTIPGSLAFIGEGAFTGNEIVSLTIPAGMKTISKAAFAKNEIETLSLPPDLESIEEEAFMGNRLHQVNIPAGLADIGEKAFALNPLEIISIGDGVQLARKSFGNSFTAFYDSHAKSADVYTFQNNTWTYSGPPYSLHVTQDGDTAELTISGYDGDKTHLKIPASIRDIPVTAIAKKAFAGKGITEIHIPASVRTIGDNAFANNPLGSLTIGFGTKLSDTSFGTAFYRYYYNNGRKAGLYIFQDGAWTSDFK